MCVFLDALYLCYLYRQMGVLALGERLLRTGELARPLCKHDHWNTEWHYRQKGAVQFEPPPYVCSFQNAVGNFPAVASKGRRK